MSPGANEGATPFFVYILGRPREHNLITIFTCYVSDVIRRGAHIGGGCNLMITLNWSILTVKGAENTPRGPGPFFYDHRFGTYDFYKKNVCATPNLRLMTPSLCKLGRH